MRRPIIDLDKLNDLARIRIDWSQADDDEPDTEAPPPPNDPGAAPDRTT